MEQYVRNLLRLTALVDKISKPSEELCLARTEQLL
jgi:hypothetical protein